MGHVVLPVGGTADGTADAALAFYTGVLGFRLRDSMRMPAEFFGGAPGDPVPRRAAPAARSRAPRSAASARQ